MGGGFGLVAMGGDLRSRGSNPSTGYWMDIFPHFMLLKIVMFVWKRPKINKKEAGIGPFFHGRKHWSSGNGSRLMITMSWVRISVLDTGWIVFHIVFKIDIIINCLHVGLACLLRQNSGSGLNLIENKYLYLSPVFVSIRLHHDSQIS